MNLRSGILAAVTALLLAAASAASAQAPAYSDDELKSFAVAIVKVQQLNQFYQPQLQSAATPEEQEKVLKTASDEMTRVVEDNGMKVHRFTQILDDLLVDPALAERVRQHIRQGP